MIRRRAMRHRALAHRYVGNGHTHCAPDHSDFPCDQQELRLRDQPPTHAHQFVWMTAHNFVAPDPQIGGGFIHMFGVEIYAAEARSGEAPHMLAFLPDGSLADESAEPFGRNDLVMSEVVTQVVAAGGLPVLAHPTDHAPGVDEVIELANDLWGIEGISAGRNVDDMLAVIDARLSAGKYTCISGGSDIHAEDHSLTTGHHVVSSDEAAPSREGIFEQVRACNFFACTVVSASHAPIEPGLTVEGGAIRFTAGAPVDQIEFVGREGRVLMTATETSEASYTPTGDEGYVRVNASREPGGARCLSQPVWLLDEPPGS